MGVRSSAFGVSCIDCRRAVPPEEPLMEVKVDSLGQSSERSLYLEDKDIQQIREVCERKSLDIESSNTKQKRATTRPASSLEPACVSLKLQDLVTLSESHRKSEGPQRLAYNLVERVKGHRRQDCTNSPLRYRKVNPSILTTSTN